MVSLMGFTILNSTVFNRSWFLPVEFSLLCTNKLLFLHYAVSSLPICIPLISFCCLIVQPSIWVLYWIDMVRVDILVLSPISEGLLQVCFHLIWYWLLVCSKLLLLYLGMGLDLSNTFNMKECCILSNAFSAFKEMMIEWFFPWVCLYSGLF